MEHIKLHFPTIHWKAAAQSYKNQFFNNQEPVINGSGLFDQMEYEKWLNNTISNSHKNTVRRDLVCADTFFAVRKSDQKIIGMIDIRHNLNNNFLKQYSGHIGYSVRPIERRKGVCSSENYKSKI